MMKLGGAQLLPVVGHGRTCECDVTTRHVSAMGLWWSLECIHDVTLNVNVVVVVVVNKCCRPENSGVLKTTNKLLENAPNVENIHVILFTYKSNNPTVIHSI